MRPRPRERVLNRFFTLCFIHTTAGGQFR
jgi:hypothetical protein